MANLGVACVQLTSTKDWMANLSQALLLMERAMMNQPRLIVLPENVFLFDAKQMREVALSDATAKIFSAVGQFAIENNVFVLIGSHPMAHDQFGNLISDGRVRQASILVGPDGKQVARYDKVHLFDVDVADKASSYRESRFIEPGEVNPVVVQIDGVSLGLTVCYDLRFPELYRCLAELGAEVVIVPSAFTFKTGEAHWHTLLQARAIENQFYVAGVDQVGWHNETRQTYGHTVAYSPWGELLDSMNESDQGSIYFKVDTDYLKEVRAAMPCLKHRRL